MMLFPSLCCASDVYRLCLVLIYGASFEFVCAARGECPLPACGDGNHEQAANELFLQDADCERHQHAWRVLCAPSCGRARLPPIGVMSVYFGWCSVCSTASIVWFSVANNRWYSVVCRISHSSLQHRSLLHGIFMMSSGSSGISSEASSTKSINDTL